MREIRFRIEGVSEADMNRAAGILAPDNELRRALVRNPDGTYSLTDYGPSSAIEILLADIKNCLLRFPNAQLHILSQETQPEYA